MNFIRIGFCISILNLICCSCNAQDSLNWKVGIWAGPNYSFRFLKSDDTSEQFIIDLRNKMEKPIAGIEVGLTISRKITRSFGISAGVQFSEVGDKAFNENSFFDPTVNDTLRSITIRFYYQSIELPVAVQYVLMKGKFNLQLSGGFGFAKFYNALSATTLDYDNRTEKRTGNNSNPATYSEFSNPNLFGTMEVITKYNLNQRWSVFMEPAFKYYFIPLVKDVPLRGYYYSIRLVAGVSFNW